MSWFFESGNKKIRKNVVISNLGVKMRDLQIDNMTI